MRTQELLDFNTELLEEVCAHEEEGGVDPRSAFVSIALDYLVDFGAVDDWEICEVRAKGLQLDAFTWDDFTGHLTLFLGIYSDNQGIESQSQSDLATVLARAENLYKKLRSGELPEVEQPHPLFDLASEIHGDRLSAVEFVIVTNTLCTLPKPRMEDVNGVQVTYDLWDLSRIYTAAISGQVRPAADVNLEKVPGGPVAALELPRCSPKYRSLLLAIPGATLAHIYGEYGDRLLERNVRSFLQAKGKVNKGIRSTILNEPDMFLAFNNGLSATAEWVDVRATNGGVTLFGIRNFQIVNGGQTTASIYNALRSDNAEIASVLVQVKLTVVEDRDLLDELVPSISRYANTQNKVQDADLSANDPYHRRLEQLSRSVVAPARAGASHHTKWFYERARGQYADARAGLGVRERREFDELNPSGQKFTKTDLAKFENTWDLLPYYVSRGNQKNFVFFSEQNKAKGGEPDEGQFRRIVARAILFRQTERLLRSEYPAYRAQIATYTLAYLARETGHKLDLESIWRSQNVSPELEDAILHYAEHIAEHLTNTRRNVGEWCKDRKCWDGLLELSIPRFPQVDGLIANGSDLQFRRSAGELGVNDEQVAAVSERGSDYWLGLAKWAKETDKLSSFQRRLSYSIGDYLRRGRQLSPKQARYAVEILKEVDRLGYTAESAG